MSGVMGKNELHEVWFLKWSVTYRCQGWWERTNYMRYDFLSEVLPTDVRGDGKERTSWGMISQVKCYLQMSGVMGKNKLHEVWFLNENLIWLSSSLTTQCIWICYSSYMQALCTDRHYLLYITEKKVGFVDLCECYFLGNETCLWEVDGKEAA